MEKGSFQLLEDPPTQNKNLHSKLIQGEQIDAVGGRVTTYRMELATRVQTLANTNAFFFRKGMNSFLPSNTSK